MTQSATLVSVALRAAADPGVEFEVTHVDGISASQHSGDTRSDREVWPLAESFTSYGNGTRLELRTRRVSPFPAEPLPDVVMRAISQRKTIIDPPELAAGPTWNLQRWGGGTPGDPDFFFNFEDKLDILLTFTADSGLATGVDADVLSQALLTVSRTAGVDVELPVTFVRSPSAGFDAEQLGSPMTTDSDPMLARGASLRMTVGLDQSDPRARFSLLTVLADFAASNRYELRVADRRFGSVSGQWILVTELKPLDGTYGHAPDRGSPDDDVESRSALLTIVGPSRQGSFASAAAALAAAGLRPRAVTCLSLHDVAFCHYEIDLDSIVAVWDALPPSFPLAELVEVFGGPDARLDDGDLHAARDHHCLVSASFRPPPPDPGLWHPVWASWEVRDASGSVGDTQTVEQLRQLFLGHLDDQGPVIADCQPEYHRFRRRSRERTVERVKFRVRLRGSDADTSSQLAVVCRDVQRALRLPGGWSLPPDMTVDPWRPPRLVKLRVARRERWLGTWLDDPR